jgi:hypothetical protein
MPAKTAAGLVGVVMKDAKVDENQVALMFACINPAGENMDYENDDGTGNYASQCWAATHARVGHKLDTLSEATAEEASRLLSSTIDGSELNTEKREQAGYPTGSITTLAAWDCAKAAGLLWTSDVTFQERVKVIVACPTKDVESRGGGPGVDGDDTRKDFDVHKGEYVHVGDYQLCFAGDGAVKMANMKTKRVDLLRTGDLLATLDGPRRVALVTVERVRAKVPMCIINGLAITPDHPFLHVDGRWHLPKQVHPVKPLYMDVLYNIELDGGHSCWVNDVLVVALGQATITPGDPAYSEWADSQWGWGWKNNPRRQRYLDDNAPVLNAHG